MKHILGNVILTLFLLLMVLCSIVTAVSASEVDETEFLTYVGNLYPMYSQYEEYKIDYEFESLFRHSGIPFDAGNTIDLISASCGRKTVIIDGNRQSIQGAFVTKESLSEAREGYFSEETPRIRKKMVITPSAMYIQSLNDYGISDVQKFSMEGRKNTYKGYPYRPLEQLELLRKGISLSRSIAAIEETAEGVVCTFISTIAHGPEGVESDLYGYQLLKFESIDAGFPKYMEMGVCRPADFDKRVVYETIDVVVDGDVPWGYSGYDYKQFAPDMHSDTVVERRYEKVRITSWEKADPLPEIFRFLLKDGTEMVVYDDDFSNPTVVEVDKEVVIEAQ